MNILFLSTEIPYPLDSGHHIRTFHTLEILSRENNIFFLAFFKKESQLRYIKNIQHLCKKIDVFPIRSSLKDPIFLFRLFINLFSIYPFMTQRYFNRRARKKIREIISEYDIDLCHCDLLHLGKYYREMEMLPKILVNHNVESLRFFRLKSIEKNVFKRVYLHFQYVKLYHFEKKTCPVFDKCIVVSEEDRKNLLKMCSLNNFVYIPNGVDAEYFNSNTVDAKTEGLIWVGNMNDPYNKDAAEFFLNYIFPIIISAVPDCSVTLVGEAPFDYINKWAKLYKNIEMTGYVDDVRPYIAKSAVFVAPIRSGGGTKLKVLNAMAQGKPVVTTSIGAEGIEAKRDEELIIADEPTDFAEKTIYLLRHPEVAKKIGLRARKVIEKKYDWRVIDKKMNRLYANVANKINPCES